MHEFGQVLLDPEARIHLMPYSIYLRLGLGEINPMSTILQLVDRSMRKLIGIVKDYFTLINSTTSLVF